MNFNRSPEKGHLEEAGYIQFVWSILNIYINLTKII